MIEPRTTQAMTDAHNRAHQERADAFANMFRAVPRILSSLRHRA